jgi:cytochrome c6
MRQALILFMVMGLLLSFSSNCFSKEKDKGKSGQALFKQYCTVCHPDGGNIINPKFTLHIKELQAHKITKPGDIIGKMRNPGPGMTKFDKKTIPDKDAKKIADYILKTFK